PGSSPVRVCIILRRPVPLDAGVGKNWRSQRPSLDELFCSPNARFQTILENDSEFHAGLLRFEDKRISASGVDVDRLFHKNVQPLPSCSDPVSRMNSGRTSHDNDVHRTMCQKRVEVSVGLSTMLACETANFLDVGSINSSYGRTQHCSHST